MKQLNIQLLMTGDELMTGDIVDSNSSMIAQYLKDLGLEVSRKVTVPDDLSMLSEEIKSLASQTDILIINGGLGPTVDDLTAQALALATDKMLEQHQDALSHLKKWCIKRDTALNKPNLKQTMLPEGCDIIANEKGSAVGFQVNFKNCTIYCTPGVPHELKTMMCQEILPQIAQRVPEGVSLNITRLQIFGIGESSIQKLIDDQLPDWPKEVELGFRAGLPLLEVKLTTKTAKALELKHKYLPRLYNLLGDHVLGTVDKRPKSLAEYVVEILTRNNQKITLAESCTGGMIASLLTQISGASNVFEAGFVTYSNNIKTQVLNVDEKTLIQHGAVSEQTVLAMAQGALAKTSADFVIAVSGIAGPEGGTQEKPVGSVWIAWGSKADIQRQYLIIPTPRVYFQNYVAAIGLDLIRRQLIQSTEVPNYIIERAMK
ncbi:MAG: CinA family nicotinamide mononucleotide deamidase-related protein [Colwellia sp.]|nr:CinA family nicotinamide mononucleotide deamidase-related protein [Colwellia sp.]